jgi:hypothetical protein
MIVFSLAVWALMPGVIANAKNPKQQSAAANLNRFIL